MIEVRIEAATTKLLDKLYRIEADCFDEEAFTKQQISYLLSDYNTIALVARDGQEIAGFIIAQIETAETEYGHIITINVQPRYRRLGIGAKMLNETEKQLKIRGISTCHLEVREDNNAAIKLYHKLGYQTLSRLEKYYGKKHGLYLKKVL
ncbi:MAG: ribosomal protein S18-alanine N-acetyltransferase [Candidatus Bathyarchaeota archaeon]|nr:ribosomal protein S18-alanine N-acetyltransferase [Candidatus Bathyarchaeota archaeon]